ncbi:major facilitator superfamily domain-containing protein [Mycena rosella]|uniref:Major facilitator superfamily domain-containing protein n=1 Tax=Mycena rosella TaxID=1033263 RepID=A0AAD7D608_MYCRO|nr:major facilitator superfamily domain-containing protein [Mycena rosella]
MPSKSPASSLNGPAAEVSTEQKDAERRFLRKLDIRLIPAVFIIYIMNYINRVAITAARLKGLEHDLRLSDIQYNVVLSVLFVTLSLGQPPSNMLLNKIKRPSVYIGGCVVAWGLASALSGVTTNYGGILVCRFFTGLPEAAFYPGAMYLLSCWYSKKELAFRSAILFSGLDIANAFGALLAAAILSGMEGTLGIPSWRWLFIVEVDAPRLCGLIFSALSATVTPLFHFQPRNTRWIDDKERRLAQARLAEDAGEADQDTQADSQFHGFKLAIGDSLVWLFSLMLFSQHLGRSVGLFFPTVAKTLGFSTSITLLLTAPPWIVAAIICVLNRTGERFFHISVWIWAMMVGFIISLCTMSVGPRYFSLFLMAIGDAGCAMTLVWASNSIPRPPAKRAAAIGIVNGMGNLGTLAGSYVWKNKWGPQYRQSSVISLVALAVSTALALVIRQLLVKMNRQLDSDAAAISSGTNEERVKKAAHLEGITFHQALEKRRGFRYLF